MNRSDGRLEPQKRLIICGQQQEPGAVLAPPGAGMIGVVFRPFGLSAFFPGPAADYAGLAIPLSDIFGAGATELAEKLFTAGDFSDRAGLLEEFLADRLKPVCPYSLNLVKECISLARLRPESVTVAGLAAGCSFSVRNLERLFKTLVGMSPKYFIRVSRFQKALGLLRRGGLELADLAQACGYYDQAHFTNEFRRFSGLTPGAFLPGAGSVCIGSELQAGGQKGAA